MLACADTSSVPHLTLEGFSVAGEHIREIVFGWNCTGCVKRNMLLSTAAQLSCAMAGNPVLREKYRKVQSVGFVLNVAS